MRLRGITTMNEVVYFSVEDCPIYINKDIIALANRPNSPLLKAMSIARGDEELGYYESDFVFSNITHSFVGYIVYRGGFCIYSPELDMVFPFVDSGKFTVLVNFKAFDIRKINTKRSPIEFTANNNIFSISNIVRVNNNGVYLMGKGMPFSVHPELVKLYTGHNTKGSPIGFEKGRVELDMGRPFMYLNNDKVFLEDLDYEQ